MGTTSHFTRYLEAEDSEQYEILRNRWAKLNWELMNKAEEAVASIKKGESTARVSPIVLAAGVGFDKLYAKRTESVKPLSFPDPLLGMVRKGLCLSNDLPTAKQSEPIATAPEPAISEIPNVHAPKPVIHFDKAACEQRRYAARSQEEKQIRLDRATALRRQRARHHAVAKPA